jgi:Tfp pilus assembly protein PilF
MDKQISIILSAIFFLLYGAIVQAQTIEGNRDVEKVKQIKEKAEAHFNQGLTALKNNQRSQARENFDQSVEVFMVSDLQNHQIFRDCFNQLTETIYRIEFPDNRKTPNTQNLATT